MLPAVPPPHLRHPGRSAAESRDLDPVRSGERSRVKPGRADEQGLIRNIIKFYLTYFGLYAYIRPVSTRGRGVCSVLMRVGDGGRREEGSHAPLLVRRPKSQGLAGRQPVSNPGCSVPFAAPCRPDPVEIRRAVTGRPGPRGYRTKRGECLPPGILRSKPPTPCAERRVSTPASRNKHLFAFHGRQAGGREARRSAPPFHLGIAGHIRPSPAPERVAGYGALWGCSAKLSSPTPSS